MRPRTVIVGLKEKLPVPWDTRPALTHPTAKELLYARTLLQKLLLSKSEAVRM